MGRLVKLLMACLLFGSCSGEPATSPAISQLYGGSRSLSSDENTCLKGTPALRAVVVSAKSPTELLDLAFAGEPSVAVQLVSCFDSRIQVELLKSFDEGGENKEVALCRANVWIAELLDRAKRGVPVRDLTAEPDFASIAARIKLQCPST